MPALEGLEIQSELEVACFWYHDLVETFLECNVNNPQFILPLERLRRLRFSEFGGSWRWHFFPVSDPHVTYLFPNLKSVSIGRHWLQYEDMIELLALKALHTLELGNLGNGWSINDLTSIDPDS